MALNDFRKKEKKVKLGEDHMLWCISGSSVVQVNLGKLMGEKNSASINEQPEYSLGRMSPKGIHAMHNALREDYTTVHTS